MKYTFLNHLLKIFLIITITALLSSCGKDFFKYTPVKDTPTKGTDRARKMLKRAEELV